MYLFWKHLSTLPLRKYPVQSTLKKHVSIFSSMSRIFGHTGLSSLGRANSLEGRWISKHRHSSIWNIEIDSLTRHTVFLMECTAVLPLYLTNKLSWKEKVLTTEWGRDLFSNWCSTILFLYLTRLSLVNINKVASGTDNANLILIKILFIYLQRDFFRLSASLISCVSERSTWLLQYSMTLLNLCATLSIRAWLYLSFIFSNDK